MTGHSDGTVNVWRVAAPAPAGWTWMERSVGEGVETEPPGCHPISRLRSMGPRAGRSHRLDACPVTAVLPLWLEPGRGNKQG